jgi:hypothetical protein
VTYGSDDDKVTSFMSDDSDDLSYRIRSLYAERGPLIVAIGAAIGSLALICLFAFLLLQSGDSEQPTTPTLTPVGSGSELDTDTFAFLSISDTGAISVTMETPIFLNVGGEEFSVQAEVLPTQGSWNPVPANETTSVWVYGSVINYVFGLDDAAENRELLERLVAGDEIVLTTRSGMSSTFVVSRRQEVSSDNREIFAQRSPGVTLVLLEEDTGEQRLVVQGRFVVSEAKSDPRVGSTVKLGETAQLENLQITANSVSFQFDVPGVPAGLAAFHVDYQMQNVGASAVDASSLSMVLIDDFGNLYALNPAASQTGNFPPLSGFIQPGQTVMATAGYQIPSGLTSSVLRWQVTISGTGSQIEVILPLGETVASPQEATVLVQEVNIVNNGTDLMILGQVTNLGSQPLLVDVTDLSLSSSGTVFLMLSVNPAFPWSVPAGQTIQFGVTFQRPPGSEAIFTVLGQSFQLTGLR